MAVSLEQMSQSRSHYELLGVSRTATAHEIRAAYLRLMKRYHPDAAPGAGGAADIVPVLNRCYAVLKDPAKRSQYDSQLQSLVCVAIPAPRQQLGRRRPIRGWPAVMLASALALAIWWVSLDSPLERSTRALAASAAAWMSSSPAPANAPPRLSLPDTSDTRRMAELGRTLPTKQAEQFSRKCFAGAVQRLQSGHVDSCVLFDVAFLYWRKTPESSALSAYFADDVVEDRHREAMTAFGSAGEPRLVKLRQMAFLALMQSLEELRLMSGSTEPLLDRSGQLKEMREGERKRLAEAGAMMGLTQGREQK